MNDKSDKPDEESQDAVASEPVAGERLAAARRQQQIALSEIAKELHLDEYKVRALEQNDFDVIGAPVFAKGHLRKYAQLVNVAADDVMADYYQLERSAGAPPALKPRKRIRQEVSPMPWIAAVLVVILAASVYWWFISGNNSAPQPATGEISSLPDAVDRRDAASIDDPADQDTAVIESEVASSNSPEAALADTSGAAEVAEVDTADLVPAGQLRLLITYSGDCWTEITDANGSRLFFDLGSNGRTVELSGDAPFNALFGNAANVSLLVNGAPYEVTATDNRGTARLTISSP